MAEVKRIACDTPAQLQEIVKDYTEFAKAAQDQDLHGTAAKFRLVAELAQKLLDQKNG